MPVLFRETVDSLAVRPDGIYVDCTAGGGGHSKAVADMLSGEGRLIAIDRDPDAIRNLREKFRPYENVTVVRDNFSHIRSVLDTLGVERVDGIMADLGVSSYQLDTAERGFSFHQEAPLDMRMSRESDSAADVLLLRGGKVRPQYRAADRQRTAEEAV